jgi:type II secretory pathway component PulF
MQKFEYKVKNERGESLKGTVEAKDEKQAAKILQDRKYLVVSLKPKGESIFNEFRGKVFTRVSLTDKVNFTRQLSTMMTAGLRVTESLEILESQSSPGMKRVVSDIAREIEGGGSLTSAVEKHPGVFDPVYAALIKAGEAAGMLDKVLSRLADNLEKQKEFKTRIKGAMIYPAIVIGGMILVASIMVIFVIPKMTSIYEEFQADLPLPTKVLLGISKFATRFWWLGIIALIGAIVLFRLLLNTPQFRKQLDRILFKIPIYGNLRQKIMLTEFTRTLGILVGAGILIVDALKIVRGSFGSPVYAQAITDARTDVEKGLPLAAAMAKTEAFPVLLPQMIAVGEETGKIDEVLAKISAYFEQEADASVKGLTTAIEPIIMIILGIGVAFLVISVIMPIYNLTSQF